MSDTPGAVGSADPPARGPLSTLRQRNFRHLFFAGVASSGGAAIGEASLVWIIYTTTQSAFAVALYGIAFTTSGVAVSLFAGVLVDRYDRRRLMILADLSRAAIIGLLALGLWIAGFNLPLPILAAVILAAFTTLFLPAQNSLIPQLVGREAVGDANGLIISSNSVVQFTGFAVAGALIATVGAIAGLGVNAITFLISAAFVASIVVPVGAARAAPGGAGTSRPGFVAELREGLRYLKGQMGLLGITISAGVNNFFLTMALTFTVVYATGPLAAGPATYGVLLGLFAIGSGAGALLAARWRTYRWAGWVWLSMGAVQGILVLGLSALPYLLPAASLAFSLGIAIGVTNATWLSAAQLIVPSEMQGRYFGIDQVGSLAVIPLAQIVGAYLVATQGVLFAYFVAGLGALLSVVAFFFWPRLRQLRSSVPVGASPA